MDENEGVLGKLPRSRPGTRSDKRQTGVTPAKGSAKAAEAAERSGTKAARPAAGTSARQAPRPGTKAAGTSAKKRSRPQHATPPPPPPQRSDPIGDVVRTGAKVAETGVKVAAGLTREVLRRFPGL